MCAKIVIKKGPEPLLRRVKCVTEETFQEFDQRSLKLPKVVLLDYDNTLVDSWPQDFQTSNEVFRLLGHPPMSPVEMLQQPHTPAVEAIAQRTNHPFEHVKQIYNKVYEDIHKELAPPLPGAKDLLIYLRSKGIWVSIVSNKEEDLLENTLERIGWLPYTNAYRGASKKKFHKPNPKVVDSILEDDYKAPVERDRVFFVGDAVSTDIKCALNAGVIPLWMSQYSVDELQMGNTGPFVVKILNCSALISLLEKIEK